MVGHRRQVGEEQVPGVRCLVSAEGQVPGGRRQVVGRGRAAANLRLLTVDCRLPC